VKFVPILAAIAVTFPMAANAQSLADTHELVWAPSGKTPAATYRMRDKPVCATGSSHHRAGKGQFMPKAPCAAATIAKAPVDAESASKPEYATK